MKCVHHTMKVHKTTIFVIKFIYVMETFHKFFSSILKYVDITIHIGKWPQRLVNHGSNNNGSKKIIKQEFEQQFLASCTRRNLHIFNYSLQLFFSYKWHLQLKWLIVAMDKLHNTLVANDDLMMMSSHR
jgi:hypothetical protein